MNILTGLATIPITLNYLGPDLFGVWMALTSFVAFLGFSDLGLGTGIQNALIRCFGKDDFVSPRRIIATGLVVLTCVALALIAAALVFLPQLPLTDWVIFEDPDSERWLLPTAQTMVIAFAIGLPCGLVQRICDAYQRGYLGYGLLMIGRILGFVGVCLAAWLHWSLPVLAGLYMGTPFVIMAIGYVTYIFAKMPWARPGLPTTDRSLLTSLFGTGSSVLLCHLSYAVMSQMPVIIIANQISAAAVTPLVVTQKLIGAASLVIAPVLISLWSPIGEAATRGDLEWIHRTIQRAVRMLIMIYAPLVLAFLLCGRPLVLFWTGTPEAVPSWSLLAGVITLSIFGVFTQLDTIILSALNRFLGRGLVGLFCGVVAWILGYLVAPVAGAEGVVWVLASFAAPALYVGTKWLVNRELKLLRHSSHPIQSQSI